MAEDIHSQPVVSESFVVKAVNVSDGKNFEIGVGFKLFVSLFDFGLTLGF